MVTHFPVDASYDFLHTELAAMSGNIAKLIEDIERLDLHRRSMMEELKVLRDVTLYYNEQHPELRAAEKTPIAEDNEDGFHDNTATLQARGPPHQRCRRTATTKRLRNQPELDIEDTIDKGDPRDSLLLYK